MRESPEFELCSNVVPDCFKTVLNGTEVPSIQILSACVTWKIEPACTGKNSVPSGSVVGRFRCIIYIYIINYAYYNYWTYVRYSVDEKFFQ